MRLEMQRIADVIPQNTTRKGRVSILMEKAIATVAKYASAMVFAFRISTISAFLVDSLLDR
jgi:hypothetical protein